MATLLHSFSTLRLDLIDWFVLEMVEPLMPLDIGIPNFLSLSLLSTPQFSSKKINVLMISRSAICAFSFSTPATTRYPITYLIKNETMEASIRSMIVASSSTKFHTFSSSCPCSWNFDILIESLGCRPA